MARVLLDEYSRLLEAAFRQPPSSDGDTPSVLGNLLSVPEEAWSWSPPRGVRSVFAIVYHLGDCKMSYGDYVFRPPEDRLDTPRLWEKANVTPREALAWLEEMHERFAESVRALPDDAELDATRYSRWGQPDVTRNFITGMFSHDSYHAGEINHIRALYMQNDAWAWE